MHVVEGVGGTFVRKVKDLVKKKRVLLISPPKGLVAGEPERPKFQTHPLGLLYVAGVLDSNGHQVRIYDAYSFGNTLGEIKREVFDFDPDVVGITSMTILAKDAYLIARTVKEINDAITVVMGGPHVSALPEEALRTGCVDVAVIGEGEHTMLEICEGEGRGFAWIKGVAYRCGERIVRTPARVKTEALDSIPFPAYHLLPSMDSYNPPPHWGKRGGFASMLTCRGCPYDCTFCSVTRDWGRKYRFRSAGNVLDELEMLHDGYGVRYVSFRDSVFTLHKRRVIEICRGMIERRIRIVWNCNGRVNEVDPEMLSWMKRAGCKAIQYGIESGNEEILSRFKGLEKDTIRRAIGMTSRAGIEAHGYFMFGLPGETKETMHDTIEFAKSLDLHSAGFTSVTPFPGSALWDYCIENNLILTTDWGEYDLKGLPPARHANLTSAEILDAQKAAFRQFYLRPKVIFRHLKDIRSMNDMTNYLYEALINLRKNKKVKRRAH